MASNPGLVALLNQSDNPTDEATAKALDQMKCWQIVLAIMNKTLIGHPFKMVVSQEGKVLSSSGMDKIWDQYQDEIKKVKADLAGQASLNAVIEEWFGEDTTNSTLTMSVLLPYPDHAAKVGESWSDTMHIEKAGMACSVTRVMRLDGQPNANGWVPLSGKIVFDFPKRVNHHVIEFSDQGNKLQANLYTDTGVMRDAHWSGQLRMSARNEDAAADSAQVMALSSAFEGSLAVKRLGCRDPQTSGLSVFGGCNLAYCLRLGNDWIPGSLKSYYDDAMLDGMPEEPFAAEYHNCRNSAWLHVTVPSADLKYQQQHPLSKVAEDTAATSKTKLIWSKLFAKGGINWVRCRMDSNTGDARKRTIWSQVGYGPKNRYFFDLTLPGACTDDAEREAVQILDSIEINPN